LQPALINLFQPRAGTDARWHPHLWRRLYGICRAHRPGSAGAAGV